MLENCEKNDKGTIRSKVYVQNFFVGRANFFNYEVKYSLFPKRTLDKSNESSSLTKKINEVPQKPFEKVQKNRSFITISKKNLANISFFLKKPFKTPYKSPKTSYKNTKIQVVFIISS